MRVVRAILFAAMMPVLSVYAVDQATMVTPEQMMQCCKTKPCSHRPGHEQDCCKKMLAMRSPFIQPPSIEASRAPYTIQAVMPAPSALLAMFSPTRELMEISHAPPTRPQIASSSLLRI